MNSKNAIRAYVVALIIFAMAFLYILWGFLVSEPFRLTVGILLTILGGYMYSIGRSEYNKFKNI